MTLDPDEGASADLFSIDHIYNISLLRLLREERARMLSLIELGLSPTQAIDLIAFSEVSDPSSGGNGPSTVLEGYFDASDRIEGGDLIVWWNDIEKDSR